MRTAARAYSVTPPGRGSTIAAAAALTVLAAALGGCAQIREATSITPPPINPSSPIAGYANQVSGERFPTPNFRQVPPKPADIRKPAQYKTAVLHEVQMRRDLNAWRVAHPELPSDSEAWADLQRHRIAAGAAPHVDATHDAESEAFAKRLREEAAQSHPNQ
jgi:hypothetical protein